MDTRYSEFGWIDAKGEAVVVHPASGPCPAGVVAIRSDMQRETLYNIVRDSLVEAFVGACKEMAGNGVVNLAAIASVTVNAIEAALKGGE